MEPKCPDVAIGASCTRASWQATATIYVHLDFLYLLNVAVLGPPEPAPSRTLQQSLAGVPCLLCGHEAPEEMPPDQIKKDDKAAKGTLVYMDNIIPNRPSNSRADVVKFVEGSMRSAGMTHH